MRKKPTTPLQFVILGLIPYTRPNLLLAFKPNQFFNELEQLSGISKHRLRRTYDRAINRGLIHSTPDSKSLSLEARQLVAPFVSASLPRAQLMIIFDVPEKYRHRRRSFRRLLQHLGCTQVQRSVWITSRDYRSILRETVCDLRLTEYVKIYAAEELQ